jgi:RNA polymerase sigma-70 factor (ECF subfamily)
MTSDVSVHALLQEAEWAQRLARALVGAEDGPDLAQDGMLAALRRRPDGERPLRPWLAHVLRNLARNRKRDDRRRRVRHVAAAADSLPPDVTPEELLSRMELQATLASMVSGLPEPYRQMILFRYYEGLTSEEIGERLGVSAGTIRWRLKVAVDQLRQRLDETFEGDRRRWVRLMTPLLPHRVPGGVVGFATAWLAASTGLVVLLAAVSPWNQRASVRSTLRGPEERRPARPPALGAILPTPAEPGGVAGCPEAEELQREVGVRRREWEDRERPDSIFDRSATNSAAYERFSVLAQRAFRCSHAVECRGIICKVRILIPESGVVAHHRCFSHEEGTVIGIPRQYLGRRGLAMSMGSPTRDLFSGEAMQQEEVYFRLATPEVEPVEVQGEQRPSSVAAGRHRKRGPPPAERSLECRAEISRLVDTVAALERQTDEVLRPQEVFVTSDANPQLAPAAREELARLLGIPPAVFPFDVECRGPVCAAKPRDDKDPMMASWLDWWRILDRRRQSALFASIDTPMATGPIYASVRTDEDRAKTDPVVVVRDFLRVADAAEVFARCKAVHRGHGTLVVRVRVAKGREPLTLDTEGEAVRTPLGACIVNDLGAIASSMEVPDTRGRLTWTFSPFLPLARSLDDRPGPWR